MAESWRALLDNDAIIAMTGHESFARGLVYARSGLVQGVTYDAEDQLVSARVRGTHWQTYATSVRLATHRAGSARVHRGQCSCPVTLDCKHAAAVLIVARTLQPIQQQLERPSWERALGRLVAAPDPVAESDRVPLALELEVQQLPGFRGSPGRMELRARPAQRGRSGKWVRSGVSWETLEASSGSHLPAGRDWMLQLRSAAGPARYVYPKTPWMTLGTAGSSLWPLLDAADDAQIALIGPGAARPRVSVSSDRASIQLDLRRDDGGGLRLAPALTIEGETVDVSSVGLLGDPAHGLFVVDRDTKPGPGTELLPLLLAPLAAPIGPELRQIVLEGQPVSVPAEDEERFLDDYYPRLRRKTAVVSSDSSVQLPVQVAPRLLLRATFRPEHRLRLDWFFAYAAVSGTRTFGIDVADDRRTLRDLVAERDLVTALPLPYARIPQIGVGPQVARPAAHVLLVEQDAVYFTDEILPQLAEHGTDIELVGEVPDYRRSDEAPLVEVSTTNDGRSDWFDLDIQVSVEGEAIAFDQLFVALHRGDEFLVLDSGVYIPLDRKEFVQLRDLIDEARTLSDTDADSASLRISTYQASLWEELVSLGVVVEQSARWSQTVSGLMDASAVEAVSVPATMQAELRPYQLEGFHWLSFLYDHGLGGILADDMGLGKTLQALALLCRVREADAKAPPFLVVAPTSVVSNWAREAARFAPHLKVVIVDRSQAKSKQPLAASAAGADLVITTYALLRIDFDSYDSVAWTAMILDEAQFVKNHRAKTYQCARRLSAGFKLAITGTPLENSLMDLWSLLSIVAPGLFPHPDRFVEFYRRPIERDGDAELMAQLRRRIRPLMLRRTKEKVAAELPAKQEQIIDVVLQPKHQRVYQTYLQRERQKILGLIEDLDKNRFTILSSLTLLRQLSLDASLVDEAHAAVPASKIDVLTEHLHELIGEGHKALVFSQFTGFLGRVRDRLDAEGITYAYLDGSTRHRDAAVQQFKTGDAPVFLISLKAGGFGLNLTEADYCFVLDPWWNPAVEAQAVDRTHRIGQTKTVLVYRLVAQGTIEEKVMELKGRKSKLFDSVMGDDVLASGTLTADEIRGLLGV